MKYGYARVSTAIQELEVQLTTLENQGCQRIFSEKYTGVKTDRPEFNELLAHLEEGDTLVATKLDRLARNRRKASKSFVNCLRKASKSIYSILGYWRIRQWADSSFKPS